MQNGCISAKWLFSGKLVVFGQKWFYLGIQLLDGQGWLYLGRVVVVGQKCDIRGDKLYSDKVFVFGQSGCIWARNVLFGQIG